MTKESPKQNDISKTSAPTQRANESAASPR